MGCQHGGGSEQGQNDGPSTDLGFADVDGKRRVRRVY